MIPVYCIQTPFGALVYLKHIFFLVKNCTSNLHLLKIAGQDMPVMDWTTRVKVAAGAARGIAYLHEDCEFLILFWISLAICVSPFLYLDLVEWRNILE